MSYNLFLDDFRYPNSLKYNSLIYSAYEMTGNPEYKDLDWVVVKNFDEFVKTIEKNGLPDTISFDHDLNDTHYYHYNTSTILTGKIDYEIIEGTGYECAKWLINKYLPENNLDLPKILIHTQNPIGRKNIQKLFENYKKSKL